MKVKSKVNRSRQQEKPAEYVNTNSPVDWWLVIVVLALLIFGVMMVYSASGVTAERLYNDKYFFFKKQVLFLIVGIIVAFICTYLPRKLINSMHYVGLVVVFFLLFLCLTPFGNTVNGASRWISFGFFSLQPFEFAKIALVLYLAYFMSEKRELVSSLTYGVVPPFLITCSLCTLLLFQPDFGGAMVLLALLFFMCLVGGTRFLYLFGSVVLFIGVFILLIVVSPYRMRRIFAFIDPFKDALDTGYQLVQSLYAMGLGGFFGVGLGGSKQKVQYLPEAHNDFIVAVVGEELGFIGISLMMLLFTLLFVRCFRIVLGQNNLRDRFTVFGLTLVIIMGAALNLAVVMGLAPPKGVAMPFFSYGGSSLIATLICVGLILNYSRTARNFTT